MEMPPGMSKCPQMITLPERDPSDASSYLIPLRDVGALVHRVSMEMLGNQ